MGRGRQGKVTTAPAPRALEGHALFAALDDRLHFARQQAGGFVFMSVPAGVALENVGDVEIELGILEPTSLAEGPNSPTILTLGSPEGEQEWLLPPLTELSHSCGFTALPGGFGQEAVPVPASLRIANEQARLQIGDQAYIAPTPVWRAAVSDWTRHAPHRSEKVGRNDPCPCGSGLKHKKCCGA